MIGRHRWFRIYPDRKTGEWYYTVHVFCDRDDMYKWFLKHQSTPDGNCNFAAIVESFKRMSLVNSRWKRHSEIGYVLYYLGNCGAGVMTHEAIHAATYYFQQRENKVLGGLSKYRHGKAFDVADERYAWVVGNLANQIVRGFWKTGVY